MATSTPTPPAAPSRTPSSLRPLSAELVALARQGLAGLRVLLALTLLVGVAYPLVVLAVGQLAFGWQANGSLVDAFGKHQRSVQEDTVGSSLIGQRFAGDGWFLPRPSAAGPGYDTLSSAGTNLGPENRDLLGSVKQRRAVVADREGVDVGAVPPDAVTSSASGLDPHISPAYAARQVHRVARARGLEASVVRRLVARSTDGRTLGVLGEARVNVLQLNISLTEATG